MAFSQCRPSSYAFQDGEYISYSVTYNLGPVWIRAAKVDFRTKLVHEKGTPCWEITSTGKTIPSIEFLFKVKDSYISLVDTTTYQTREFRRYIYENGYVLQNTSWFDYRNDIIYSNTKRNDNPLVTDTLAMKKPCSFDMVSSCFFVRSLDMDTLIPEKPYPVNIAIDDSVYSILVKLNGKEQVMNEDGKSYSCLKFTATMVEGTVFEKEQEAFIWITNDDNHIPVYIEARIIVGSVKAYLKEAKGLKYPLTSLVRK